MSLLYFLVIIYMYVRTPNRLSHIGYFLQLVSVFIIYPYLVIMYTYVRTYL